MTYDSFREGKVEFIVPSLNTPCQTYYKIFGTIDAHVTPIVVLHGGPAAGHEYCLPFSELWSRYGIPVILYDQIGCAQSTHLPQKRGDVNFWTTDLFVLELENFLDKLQLNRSDGPGYHLLGHSWGGIVAVEFAGRRPRGLQKLILMGVPASGQLFYEGLWELTKELSPESQQALHEAVQTYDFTSPAYLAAVNEHRHTFLCRADPWPALMEMTPKNQQKDGVVKEIMHGPSPWVYNGLLRHMNCTPSLPNIEVPTFVLNGEFDTTQYKPTVPFFNLIPRVRWVTLANASHIAYLDSAEMLAKVLGLVAEFLGVEKLNA